MSNIRLLMLAYRAILATTLGVCYLSAAIALVAFLALMPEFVLYLLNLLAPIAQYIKGILWGLFPYESPRWIRTAGLWMSWATQKTLSLAKAREEAVGRMVLLDGFLLLTLVAWVFYKISGLLINFKVARWFNRRYVLLTRKRYEFIAATLWRATEKIRKQQDELVEARRRIGELELALDTQNTCRGQ